MNEIAVRLIVVYIRAGEPKAGEPRVVEPKAGGEPRAGEPRAGEPRVGEPRAGELRVGEPRAGEPRLPETSFYLPVVPLGHRQWFGQVDRASNVKTNLVLKIRQAEVRMLDCMAHNGSITKPILF